MRVRPPHLSSVGLLVAQALVTSPAFAAAAIAITKTITIQLPSPNKISTIEATLHPAKVTDSVFTIRNSVGNKTVELFRGRIDYRPEAHWFGEDYASIKLIGPGKHSQTIVYDLIQNRRTIAVPDLIAIDPPRMIAAIVDQNSLRIVKLFNLKEVGVYYRENAIELDGNFPDKPMLDMIEKAAFTPRGDFLLRYRAANKVILGLRVSGQQFLF